jgi:hypothetical protein
MSPLLGQDSWTRAERIRSTKTAVQDAIHQRAALTHGQTHVAQATNNGSEEIGRQVIWCAPSGCGDFERHVGSRLNRLV